MRVVIALLFALLLVSCGGGSSTPDPGGNTPDPTVNPVGEYNVWPENIPTDAQPWFIVDIDTDPVYSLYREATYQDGYVGAITFNGNNFTHTGRTDEHGVRVDISGTVSETGLTSLWIEYRDNAEIDRMNWVGTRESD